MFTTNICIYIVCWWLGVSCQSRSTLTSVSSDISSRDNIITNAMVTLLYLNSSWVLYMVTTCTYVVVVYQLLVDMSLMTPGKNDALYHTSFNYICRQDVILHYTASLPNRYDIGRFRWSGYEGLCIDLVEFPYKSKHSSNKLDSTWYPNSGHWGTLYC